MDESKIVGDTITFVPYNKLHVPKYHKWMKDPKLHELTGSIYLTLEQEYKVQEECKLDKNKYTFIILENYLLDKFDGDEIKSMIGDINLFKNTENSNEAEIGIMIAENKYKRKGKGEESLKMMINLAYNYLNVELIYAKIQVDNIPSINLFKKLGFVEKSTSEFFQETTFELILDRNKISSNLDLENHYKFIKINNNYY